jgi:hypothetical protein
LVKMLGERRAEAAAAERKRLREKAD